MGSYWRFDQKTLSGTWNGGALKATSLPNRCFRGSKSPSLGCFQACATSTFAFGSLLRWLWFH